MFDFLIHTGITGIVGVFVVFCVVFFLAESGKEISFWGIKFHKKYKVSSPVKRWRKLPKQLPGDWVVVLRAFVTFDKTFVQESRLHEEAYDLAEFSAIKTKSVCAEMESYGLIRITGNHVALLDKALPLANKVEPENK